MRTLQKETVLAGTLAAPLGTDGILTPKQAARLLGVSVSTLCVWRKRQIGPVWRVRQLSNRIYYLRIDLEEWRAADPVFIPIPAPRKRGDDPVHEGIVVWHRSRTG